MGMYESQRLRIKEGCQQSAKRRQCPKCKRLSAIKTTVSVWDGRWWEFCRWCDYEARTI